MTLHTHTTPKVYSVETMPDYWVAEGTDGCLYKVPSQPGGWLQVDKYEGHGTELKRVEPEKARAIVWLTYGDLGAVTIAEG